MDITSSFATGTDSAVIDYLSCEFPELLPPILRNASRISDPQEREWAIRGGYTDAVVEHWKTNPTVPPVPADDEYLQNLVWDVSLDRKFEKVKDSYKPEIDHLRKLWVHANREAASEFCYKRSDREESCQRVFKRYVEQDLEDLKEELPPEDNQDLSPEQIAELKIANREIQQRDFLKQAFKWKKAVPLETLQELSVLLRPHLLVWCKLVFPTGYLSQRKGYWIVLQGNIKICLKTGATRHLGVKGYKKQNFLLMGIHPLHWWIGHTGEYFAPAAKSLKEWCLRQQAEPAKEEGPFHKPVWEVVKIFYHVMFNCGPESKYEGVARDIWEMFRDIFGPVCTKQEPDFCSSYRMKDFLHWLLESPSPHIKLEHRIDRTKKEVWEVRVGVPLEETTTRDSLCEEFGFDVVAAWDELEERGWKM